MNIVHKNRVWCLQHDAAAIHKRRSSDITVNLQNITTNLVAKFQSRYDNFRNWMIQICIICMLYRCHVQFTEDGAVAAACALNGSLLLGRDLTIATSTPINKPDSGEGGARSHRQQQQQFEPGKPVDGCWFCLSSEQVNP